MKVTWVYVVLRLAVGVCKECPHRESTIQQSIESGPFGSVGSRYPHRILIHNHQSPTKTPADTLFGCGLTAVRIRIHQISEATRSSHPITIASSLDLIQLAICRTIAAKTFISRFGVAEIALIHIQCRTDYGPANPDSISTPTGLAFFL